jgi:hypothetical protein
MNACYIALVLCFNILSSSIDLQEVVIDGNQEVFTLSNMKSSKVGFLSLSYVTTSMKELLTVINNNAITLNYPVVHIKWHNRTGGVCSSKTHVLRMAVSLIMNSRSCN